jgi:hypothetical protein
VITKPDDREEEPVDTTLRLVFSGLFLLIVGGITYWIFRGVSRNLDGTMIAHAERQGMFKRQVTTLEASRFRTVSDDGETARNWEAFDRIVVHGNLMMLFFGQTAFLIPRRAFASDEGFQSFVDTARQYHRLARPGLYIKHLEGGAPRPE